MKRSTQNRAQAHCYSSIWGGEKTLPLTSAFPQGKGMSATTSEWIDPQRDMSHSMVENLISSTGSELV